MRQFFRYLALAVFLAFCMAGVAGADIKLPDPLTDGGMGLFQALKQRASAPGGDFPTVPLSMEELSTVLWAASGLNRGDKGWTVPMEHGLPPYVDIYAVLDSGVFKYDWGTNSLMDVSKEDIREIVGRQRFVASAPCNLILVSSRVGLETVTDEELKKQFAAVAVGAMTQDIYLAAAALNIGARYIHSIKFAETATALSLPEGDEIICLMILGK
ncbi:MAG: nitroreductase family protein [Synergistaceae bacterium]|nr:nitroreductase family protein [Synergistaceae bacterium]